MSLSIINNVKKMNIKEVLWQGFVWFIVIAMIVSPIAVYLI